RLHLFPIRKHDMRSIGLPCSFGHAFQSLSDDLDALPHLRKPYPISRINVVFLPRWHLKVEVFVTRIQLIFPNVQLEPSAANHRPTDAQIEYVLKANKANPSRPSHRDRIRIEQVLVLVHLARKRADKFPDRLLPSARRLQRQPADADVASHHPLSRKHLEN